MNDLWWWWWWWCVVWMNLEPSRIFVQFNESTETIRAETTWYEKKVEIIAEKIITNKNERTKTKIEKQHLFEWNKTKIWWWKLNTKRVSILNEFVCFVFGWLVALRWACDLPRCKWFPELAIFFFIFRFCFAHFLVFIISLFDLFDWVCLCGAHTQFEAPKAHGHSDRDTKKTRTKLLIKSKFTWQLLLLFFLYFLLLCVVVVVLVWF